MENVSMRFRLESLSFKETNWFWWKLVEINLECLWRDDCTENEKIFIYFSNFSEIEKILVFRKNIFIYSFK